ncbi:MAG: NADH-quinone oxidoreductase subunit N [Dehalococcoidia bacterium]|nr:NADH-quinone oxidoreductase subunit N [Dehalococcoidia bacterium]
MNLYLLAPEISLCALALVVILLDLFIGRKWILGAVSIAGLIVPAAFTIALWGTNETSFNGMLVVDQFSLFFNLFFLVSTALVLLSSTEYASKFAAFRGEYYALVLLAAMGMMLMASTRELISIYIALELTGISLYALTGFLKDPKSSEAGLKYLLLGAVASAVLLYGMALVFGLTGTTHLEGIKAAISAEGLLASPALLMGIVLLVAGFGFKIATVPFQMWVPDVYEGAPTPITAYLSVASKAAGFAVILRVFYEALGPVSLDWSIIFAVLAAITMTLGNVVAIWQTNIKRMLGYSSIAQAGYLMIGLATVSALEPGAIGSSGPSALVFFLACYALTNLGAFIAIIAISNKIDSDEISDYSGMARRAPLLSLALALCLISLIGIPPTAGFMAKIYIFSAAVDYGLIWLVIVAVINTVISAYYYLRVIRVMFLGAPLSEERVPSSGALRAALSFACLGVLVLGIYPWVLLRIAEAAVRMFP